MNTKTLCPIPWHHIFIQTSGMQKACCYSEYSVEERQRNSSSISKAKSIADLQNSDVLKELRQGMLEGKKPDACRRCWQLEAKGSPSPRLNYIKEFGWDLEDIADLSVDIVPNDLESLDLRLGSNCNFSCRMCHPSQSSKLVHVFSKLDKAKSFASPNRGIGDYDWAARSDSWEKLLPAINKLRKIHLAGGEPFLAPKHLWLLKELVRSGASRNVVLQYNTNLSILPKELIRIIPEFRSIHFIASFDGVGKIQEYIRVGSSWERSKENLIQLSDLAEKYKNITLSLNSTIQAQNFFHLPDLFLELQELNQSSRLIPKLPFFVMVDDPKFLHVSNMDDEEKRNTRSRIEDFLEGFDDSGNYQMQIEQLKGALKELDRNQNQQQAKQRQIFTQEFDQITGASLN